MAVLTAKEKKQLLQDGYSKADVTEITICVKNISYTLIANEGTELTIAESEAKERLGQEEWLKGVARATFFTDTTRDGLSGERIHIHCKNYL